MKPRYATALVLYCGWYLLGAPPQTTGQGLPSASAPVSQWTVLDVFDTERDCWDGEQEQVNPSKTSTQSQAETANHPAALKCVSTDDPRLSK